MVLPDRARTQTRKLGQELHVQRSSGFFPPERKSGQRGARGDRGARQEAVREERAGLESPRSGVTRCLTCPHSLLLGGVRATPVAPWGLMAAKCWNHWTPRPGSAPRQATGLPDTRWTGCLLRDSHEPNPEPKAAPLHGGTRGQAGLLISQLQASPESSPQAPSARL